MTSDFWWFLFSVVFIIFFVLLPGVILYVASFLVTGHFGSVWMFAANVVFSWALWYLTRLFLRGA